MSLAIRLDAVGGVAGDMFAAAMVDALPDLRPRVLEDAAAVLPPGTGTPVFEPGTSAGLHCLRFRLAPPAEAGVQMLATRMTTPRVTTPRMTSPRTITRA